MKFHKKFVVNTRDTLSDGHSIRNNAEETYAAIADKELAINQAKYQNSFNPKRKKDKTSIFKRQYFWIYASEIRESEKTKYTELKIRIVY